MGKLHRTTLAIAAKNRTLATLHWLWFECPAAGATHIAHSSMTRFAIEKSAKVTSVRAQQALTCTSAQGLPRYPVSKCHEFAALVRGHGPVLYLLAPFFPSSFGTSHGYNRCHRCWALRTISDSSDSKSTSKTSKTSLSCPGISNNLSRPSRQQIWQSNRAK